ncbi:MAG: hypothetical protein JM58_06015 [Peptococcaceae bacterium BICA1-8]|nr:MAG: hypothetical protein JM58_06015 [Peptococcaceae bacterium BICA1-8]
MDITYTLTTDKKLEQVVDDVKKELRELKFGTLWELDIPAKLKEKDVEFKGKATILEVCNPHQAKKALELNMDVVYFLPCKVVVFEDNGQTKLGMIKPTIFMDMLKDERLQEFALDVESTIKLALDRAV